MGKYDFKSLGVVMILSLAAVTIMSWMLSQYTDFPILKSGPAFILLLITTFLVFMFVIARDGKLDKGEIVTIIIVAIALVGSGVALNKFLPEIFSVLPQQTQEFFSAFG